MSDTVRHMADGTKISVRLGPEQVEHLDELADEAGCSRSLVLRRLLDAAGPGAAAGTAGARLSPDELLDGLTERARAGSAPALRALLARADGEEHLARLKSLSTD